MNATLKTMMTMHDNKDIYGNNNDNRIILKSIHIVFRQ